jgi:hypothetical protein
VDISGFAVDRKWICQCRANGSDGSWSAIEETMSAEACKQA